MRFVVAMVCAAAAALAATLLIAGPTASLVVRQFIFESPDQVGDLHALVFMGVNAAALISGWMFGWGLTAALAGPQDGNEG